MLAVDFFVVDCAVTLRRAYVSPAPTAACCRDSASPTVARRPPSAPTAGPGRGIDVAVSTPLAGRRWKCGDGRCGGLHCIRLARRLDGLDRGVDARGRVSSHRCGGLHGDTSSPPLVSASNNDVRDQHADRRPDRAKSDRVKVMRSFHARSKRRRASRKGKCHEDHRMGDRRLPVGVQRLDLGQHLAHSTGARLLVLHVQESGSRERGIPHRQEHPRGHGAPSPRRSTARGGESTRYWQQANPQQVVRRG
jgi:hypothetical protein